MAFSNIFIKSGFWKRTNHPVKGDLSVDEIINASVETNAIDAMQQLGGSTISEPTLIEIGRMNSLNAPTTGQQRFALHNFRSPKLVTGVRWYQTTQGVYTASDYCGVGLYKINGSTAILTLVASSANDGNMFKISSNTWGNKDFTTPYSASAGIYFASLLWNSSAAPTPPAWGAGVINNVAVSTVDLPNNSKLNVALNSQASFQTTIAMSALSTNTSTHYFSLY